MGAIDRVPEEDESLRQRYRVRRGGRQRHVRHRGERRTEQQKVIRRRHFSRGIDAYR